MAPLFASAFLALACVASAEEVNVWGVSSPGRRLQTGQCPPNAFFDQSSSKCQCESNGFLPVYSWNATTGEQGSLSACEDCSFHNRVNGVWGGPSNPDVCVCPFSAPYLNTTVNPNRCEPCPRDTQWNGDVCTSGGDAPGSGNNSTTGGTTCPPGYEFVANSTTGGGTCVYSQGTSNCPANAYLNTQGQCVCENPGFTFNYTSSSCQSTGGASTCPEGASLTTNAAGNTTCQCGPGFQPVEDDGVLFCNPCSNLGVPGGLYNPATNACSCPPGQALNTTTNRCADLPPCGPLQERTSASPVCQCVAGYELAIVYGMDPVTGQWGETSGCYPKCPVGSFRSGANCFCEGEGSYAVNNATTGQLIRCGSCADEGVAGGMFMGWTANGKPNCTCSYSAQYQTFTYFNASAGACMPYPDCTAPTAGRTQEGFCQCGMKQSPMEEFRQMNDFVPVYGSKPAAGATVPLGVNPATGPLLDCELLPACPQPASRKTQGGACVCPNESWSYAFAPVTVNGSLTCASCMSLGFDGGLYVPGSNPPTCACDGNDQLVNGTCMYTCPTNNGAVLERGFCTCPANKPVTLQRADKRVSGCTNCDDLGLIGGFYEFTVQNCTCPQGRIAQVINATHSQCVVHSNTTTGGGSGPGTGPTTPSCPDLATYNDRTRTCVCAPGYALNTTSNLCVAVTSPGGGGSPGNATAPTCPGNSTFMAAVSRCVCNNGFVGSVSAVTGNLESCRLNPCPANAYPNEFEQCSCNAGFEAVYTAWPDFMCLPSCPEGSYRDYSSPGMATCTCQFPELKIFKNGTLTGCKTCKDYGVEGGFFVMGGGEDGKDGPAAGGSTTGGSTGGSTASGVQCTCPQGQYLNGTQCTPLPECPSIPTVGRNYKNLCTCGLFGEFIDEVFYGENDYLSIYTPLKHAEVAPIGVDPVNGYLTNCTRLPACPANSKRNSRGGPCECNDRGLAPTYNSAGVLTTCTPCSSLNFTGGYAVNNTGRNGNPGQCACDPRDRYNATALRCMYTCPANSTHVGNSMNTPVCACNAGFVSTYREFITGSVGGMLDSCQTCQQWGLWNGVFNPSRNMCACANLTVQVNMGSYNACIPYDQLACPANAEGTPEGCKCRAGFIPFINPTNNALVCRTCGDYGVEGGVFDSLTSSCKCPVGTTVEVVSNTTTRCKAPSCPANSTRTSTAIDAPCQCNAPLVANFTFDARGGSSFNCITCDRSLPGSTFNSTGRYCACPAGSVSVYTRPGDFNSGMACRTPLNAACPRNATRAGTDSPCTCAAGLVPLFSSGTTGTQVLTDCMPCNQFSGITGPAAYNATTRSCQCAPRHALVPSAMGFGGTCALIPAACPTGTARNATTSRCECAEPTVAWSPVPQLGASQATPPGWSSNSTTPFCVARCGVGMFYSFSDARCVCLPGTAPSQRTTTGAVLSCSVAPQISAAGPAAALLPRDVTATLTSPGTSEILSYSMVEGAGISITIAASTAVPIQEGQQVLVNVTLVAPPGNASTTFDASRFRLQPSFVVLTRNISTATVSVVAVDDQLVNGLAAAHVRASVDTLLTTATEYVRAPVAVSVPVVAVNNDEARLIVTTLRATITDADSSMAIEGGSWPVFNVRLTADPGAGVSVALAVDGEVSPDVFVPGLMQSAGVTTFTPATLTTNNWEQGIDFTAVTTPATTARNARGTAVIRVRTVSTVLPFNNRVGNNTFSFFRWSAVRPLVYAPSSIAEGNSGTLQVTLPGTIPVDTGIALFATLEGSSNRNSRLTLSAVFEEDPRKLQASGPGSAAGGNVNQVAVFFNSETATKNNTLSIAFAQDAYPAGREVVRVCFNNSMFPLVPVVCSTPITLVDDDRPGITQPTFRTLVEGGWATFNKDGRLRLREGAITAIDVGVSTEIRGRVSFVVGENRTVAGSTTPRAPLVKVETALAEVSATTMNTTLLVSGLRDTVLQDTSDESRRGVLTITAYAAVTAGTAAADPAYMQPITISIPFVLVDANDGVNGTVVPTLTLGPRGLTIGEGGSASVNVTLSPTPGAGRSVRVRLNAPTGMTVTPSTLTFFGPEAGVPPASLLQTVTVSVVDDNVVGEASYRVDLTATVEAEGTNSITFLATTPGALRVTINDNDVPKVVLDKTSVSVTEDYESESSGKVGVSLSVAPPAGQTVRVIITTAQGMCTDAAGALPPAPSTVCFTNEQCTVKGLPRCVVPPFATKAAVSTEALLFTAENYDVPQTITVTAVQDNVYEDAPSKVVRVGGETSVVGRETHPGLIRVRVESGPSAFLTTQPVTVDVAITDVDVPGLLLMTDAEGAVLMEAPVVTPLVGRLILATRPLARVFIRGVPVTGFGLTLAPSEVSIPADAWSTGQTLTFRIADNKVAQGDAERSFTYDVPLTVTVGSFDPAYNFTMMAPMTVVDDDRVGVTVTPRAFATAASAMVRPALREGSTVPTPQFSVSLSSRPSANVTVSFEEGTLDGEWATFTDPCGAYPTTGSQLRLATGSTTAAASITFTPNDWEMPRTASFIARADGRREGVTEVPVNVKITTTDKAFSALEVPSQTVMVSDELLVDPPALPVARFSDDYSQVTLSFDQAFTARLPREQAAWTTTDFANCSNWLSVVRSTVTPPSARTCASSLLASEVSTTAAMLGEGAVCQPFRRPFTIVLGARATITASDKIVLLADRFTAETGVMALRSTVGNVAVLDALNPINPSILVNNGRNVSTIGSCDTATVSANPSGTAGRPFTITWTASDYRENGVSASVPVALSEALATSTTGAVLTTGRFPAGASVTLTVTVTNFMSKQASASVTITRSDAPKPVLALPASATVMRSAGLRLELSARLPSCDNAATTTTGPALTFYWYDITNNGAAVLPASYMATAAPTGESFTAPNALPLRFTGRLVSIDGLDLPPRTYRLRVYAVPASNRANWASADIEVVVAADALVANIEGGDEKLVRAGSALILDGSASGEPTPALRAVQTGITYAWTCAKADNTACGFTVPAGATAEIDGASLSADTTYVFTLTVSAAGRPSVSRSQRVTVSGLATPTLFGPEFSDRSTFVNGYLPNIQTTISVTAELVGSPDQAFSYSWYMAEGSLPETVLASGGKGLLTLPPSAVSPDTKYTLCVTVESVTPVASRGKGCVSFETAPAPSVSGLSVVKVEGTTNEWKVGLEFAKAVDTILYSYLTAEAVSSAANALRAAGVAPGSSGLETGLAYARLAGVQGGLFGLVYRGGAGDTTFVSNLLPSGNLVVCAFGLSVTGLSSSTCTAVTVPTVTLTASDALSLLTSGTKSGDATQAMGTVSYVINTFDTPTSSGRRLAAMTVSTLKSTITATQSALDAVLAGSGSDLGSFAATLSNVAASVQAIGDAADKTATKDMVLATLRAMVSRRITITGAAVDALTSSLVAIGNTPQVDLVGLLALELEDAPNAFSFSAIEGRTLTAGSSGLTRDAVTLSNAISVATAAVDARDAAQASSNPVVIVSTGPGVAVPRDGGVAVRNVTVPIEVQVAGMPPRASGDRSPLVTITMPVSSLSLSGPLNTILPHLEAVYAGPDGIAKHDGVAMHYDATAQTVTLYATHNSTFTVAEGSGTGIIVSATSGGAATSTATVTEGTTTNFFVRLPSQPDATVTIALSMPSGVCVLSSGNMEVVSGNARTCSVDGDCSSGATCKSQLATFTPSTLTFGPTDWSSNKAVSVVATADGVYEPEAPVVGRLSLVPSSTDTRYDATGVCTDAECTSSAGNAGATLDITVTDINTPAVTVSALSASTTSESSTGTVSYTVVLTSKPFSDVTVTPGTTSAAVQISPASVTFTSDNWATPQTVTVTPVDDDVITGDRNAVIAHTIQSTDQYYGSVTAVSRTLTVSEDDVAGTVVSTPSPSVIAEDGAGSSTSITVRLSARPASSVTVTMSSLVNDKPATVTVGGAGVTGGQVTIEPDNWNTGATITLSSSGNGVATGNAIISVGLSFSSSDSAFANLPSVNRSFTILDVDGAGVVPGLEYNAAVTEGSSTTYSVTLQKIPEAEVTVQLSVVKGDPSSDFPIPFTVSPATLVFDQSTAKIPQTVTVTAAQDNIAYPANLKFHVRHSIKPVTSGGDSSYQALAPLDVPITVGEDDTPSIILQPADISLLSVASSVLTVKIGTAPVTNVVVSLSGSNGISLTTSSVTLTPSTWNTGAQVTVNKLNQVHGAMTVTVTATSGGEGSGDYSSFEPFFTQATVQLPEILPTPTATATASPTATGTATATQSSGAQIPTATATATATASAAVPSASPSPSSVPKPEVAVGLTIAGVSTSSFTSEATVKLIARSIAGATGLAEGAVVIKRAVDAATGAVLYQNTSHTEESGHVHRRLSLGAPRVLTVGSVRIEALLLTTTAAEAAVLGRSIAGDVTAFGGNVLNRLKTADAATFGSASVTVEPPIFYAGAAPGEEEKKSSFPGGGIAGIIIALVVVVAAVAFYWVRKQRLAAEEGKELEDIAKRAGNAPPQQASTSVAFEGGAVEGANPMVRRNLPSSMDAESSRAMVSPVKTAVGVPGRGPVGRRNYNPVTTEGQGTVV